MSVNRKYIITGVVVLIIFILVLYFSKIVQAARIYLLNETTNYTGGTGWLSDQNLPQGIRLNNPGLIRKTNETWLGKVPAAENPEAFEKFYTYELGIRALIKNVQSIHRNGNNTISKLVNTWAPPAENDSVLYVQHIQSWSGINQDQVFDRNDFTSMKAIVTAMIRQENGPGYLTDEQFTNAWAIL